MIRLRKMSSLRRKRDNCSRTWTKESRLWVSNQRQILMGWLTQPKKLRKLLIRENLWRLSSNRLKKLSSSEMS